MRWQSIDRIAKKLQSVMRMQEFEFLEPALEIAHWSVSIIALKVEYLASGGRFSRHRRVAFP